MVENGEIVKFCDDCWRGEPSEEAIVILKDKTAQRADYWNDIRTRVTTHEGEILHGRRGESYQKRYAKKYLGRDIGNTRPISADRVREFEKTGR